MRYDDIVIEITGQSVRTDAGKRVGKYSVRVLQSPVGEMTPAQAIAVEFDEKELQRLLDRLEKRELDRAGMIGLGRTLAALLLPVAPEGGGPSVIDFLRGSLLKAAADTGVRLRLRLPNELSVIPWEYAFVEREGGEGMDGFLGLDPRVAIVRHEALAAPMDPPMVTGNLKIVAAMAAAEGLPELNLDQEMEVLTDALDDVRGVSIVPCEHATLTKLQPLLPGAGIFHFAGHGDFTRQMGERPGTYTGTGFFAFEDAPVAAEQIGINLQGNGVRLAYLAGCNTGRRDGVNVWSGIAPALVKAGVPAVVGNQYAIQDTSAIAFCRGFYEALSGGLPLERAMTAGRIAVFNEDPEGRDWGVPVLYMRAADGQLFKGAADQTERARARQAAEARIKVRASEVKAGGLLQAADIGRMLDGAVMASVTVSGKVYGKVNVATVERMEGGRLDASADVGSVEKGGSVIGVKIDNVGFDMEKPDRERRHTARAKPPASVPEPAPRKTAKAKPPAQVQAPTPPPAPAPSTPVAPGAAPGGARRSSPHQKLSRNRPRPATGADAPQSTSNVNVGTVSGGTVIGTQTNTRHTTGISGDNLQIGSVTIINSTPPADADPSAEMIEERIRLDVALPKTAVIDEPFDVVIAVLQPEAPPLSISDLDQVASAAGRVFREDEADVVRYRVEVTGAGFTVVPPTFLFKLRTGENSSPIAFQVTASKAGRRSLFVNAYQESGDLAAQTRLAIEVKVAVAPNS